VRRVACAKRLRKVKTVPATHDGRLTISLTPEPRLLLALPSLLYPYSPLCDLISNLSSSAARDASSCHRPLLLLVLPVDVERESALSSHIS
jgi:hypothetical protein